MPVFMPKPPVGDMTWAASPAMKPRPLAIALGDQFAAHPRQHAQNLELEIAADGAADRGRDLFGRVFALLATRR